MEKLSRALGVLYETYVKWNCIRKSERRNSEQNFPVFKFPT
jgi:hypothetical protein